MGTTEQQKTEIGTLTKENQQQKTALAEKDTKIKAQEATLAEKAAKLAEQAAKLAEKEAQIKDKTRKLENETRKLKHKKRHLRNKKSNLRKSLKTKTRQLKHEKRHLQKKKRHLRKSLKTKTQIKALTEENKVFQAVKEAYYALIGENEENLDTIARVLVRTNLVVNNGESSASKGVKNGHADNYQIKKVLEVLAKSKEFTPGTPLFGAFTTVTAIIGDMFRDDAMLKFVEALKQVPAIKTKMLEVSPDELMKCNASRRKIHVGAIKNLHTQKSVSANGKLTVNRQNTVVQGKFNQGIGQVPKSNFAPVRSVIGNKQSIAKPQMKQQIPPSQKPHNGSQRS